MLYYSAYPYYFIFIDLKCSFIVDDSYDEDLLDISFIQITQSTLDDNSVVIILPYDNADNIHPAASFTISPDGQSAVILLSQDADFFNPDATSTTILGMTLLESTEESFQLELLDTSSQSSSIGMTNDPFDMNLSVSDEFCLERSIKLTW